MGALGVDGKDLVAGARQQNGVLADVTGKHAALTQLLAGDALR
jgi:hypothetical protein